MMRVRGLLPTTFLRATLGNLRSVPNVKHVFICVADHFEPDWRGADRTIQDARVKRWRTEYPSFYGKFEDSRGRPPQHSFFYPAEIYEPKHVDQLAELSREGWGEVEVHLHHDNDTADGLRKTLSRFKETLHHRHGLLQKDSNGEIRFGFIHGNWALDNSRPDRSHCGVDNEISVLRELGCYADFTMPSAPDVTQVRTINQIYYAIDDPTRPNSHDTGICASVHRTRPEQGLMIIPGPLLVVLPGIRGNRKSRLENGNLAGKQHPSIERLRVWLKARVGVAGHRHWAFLKLHTHGTQERNSEALFGTSMEAFHTGLAQYSQERGFRYYYVTAREMAQLVTQAERGQSAPDFENLSFD